MANYESLKAAIQDVVKTNGNNEITGALLQQSLLAMINSLGDGYQYMGIATPTTNPGTPDQKVFYIAAAAGTYSNFNSVVVANNEFAILKYNTSWTKETFARLFIEHNSNDIFKNLVQTNWNNTIEELYLKPSLFTQTITGAILLSSQGLTFRVWSNNNGNNWQANNDVTGRSNGEIIPITCTFSNLTGVNVGDIIGYVVFKDINTFLANYSGSDNRLNIPYVTNILLQPNIYKQSILNDVVNYIPDNSLTGAKFVDHSISSLKLGICETVVSKNLLNPDLFHTNRWVNAYGGLDLVTNLYGYFDYIQISPNTQYHVSNASDSPLSNRTDNYIAFYDANKSFISSIPANTTDFTTPANAVYVRISVVVRQKTDEMLEIGNARTSYEPYSPPQEKINPIYVIFPQNGVNTDNIKDGAVTQQKLAGNVSVPPRPVEFKGLQNSGDNIAVGSYIETELVHITKNTLFVSEINGTIQSVKCGVGRNSTYYEGSIEITPTELIVNKGSGTTTFSHGLTLGNRTIATISKNNEAQVTIKIINDYGAIFSQTVSWGSQVGRPFLLNNNTSGNISAKIQFMPRDINQKIWMFGDSYFSFDSSARWPYYMLSWGYNQWLADARGGENATEGLADFQVLLGTGKRPSFAVWCLGMNKGADSGGSVNTTWLQKTNAFLTLCEEYHITPILATIPSVPSEIHTKLNEWVRASGYRFIDFAKAVENGTNYYWKGWGTDGQLLSNDEVHPSVKGAIVLASQAMIDFPEISIVE